MHPTDELEWHPITLPSLGRYYGGKVPGGVLKITPWTVVQEEAIIRYSGSMGGDLERELIKNNIGYPPGFSYEDLLLTDQFFLLVNLRSISLVPKMTVVHGCPKCNNIHEVQIDLTKLQAKTPDETDPEEPFKVFLPKKKIDASVRFQRVSDLAAVDKYLSEHPGAVNSTRRLFLYARQLVSIGGASLKFDEKLEFVSKLALLDLNAINSMLEKLSPGITGKASVECPKCQHVDNDWMLALTDGFFRPKAIDLEGP